VPGLYENSGLWGGSSGLWDGTVGLSGTVVPVVLTGFDASFNSANLVYDEDDRLVFRTDAVQRRAVRGRTGHLTGKWYVELLPLVVRFRFAGVVDSSFTVNGAGGPAGMNRVGVQGDELVYFGGSDVIGFATPGTIVRIAWDGDADLLWTKLGGGNWNGSAGADPVTGVGGVSTAGLVGPAYVGATLRPVVNATVRYRIPGDLGYTLPTGFAEWAS